MIKEIRKMGVEREILVPDIGDFKNVEIIEILVKPGDTVKPEESLITLESDKAAMEVPSSHGGLVKSLKVKVGDRVSKGSPILVLDEAGAEEKRTEQPTLAHSHSNQAVEHTSPAKPMAAQETLDQPKELIPFIKPESLPNAESLPEFEEHSSLPHASPSVRRFARELGADIQKIRGSGPKGRIIKEDVQQFVKESLKRAEQPPASGAFVLPPIPEMDFSRFGIVERQPLSRIKKLSGPNLHKSWLSIPHVTQHDEADITDLEAFRLSLKTEAEKRGVKLTFFPFIIKAVVATMKVYPSFNASLGAGGEDLIIKRYYHFGIAVDTPEGLVVPVLRDVDQKGIFDLSVELTELGNKARGKKLRGADLEGASFTISSLGGIGGTAFTPIINPPEVAILGLSKAQTKPFYQDGQFVPRLILPLSLSYDHRVIDGAEAARFVTYLSSVLADMRRVLL
jgi:pyruvate dehydrogenase E2 component (dihydrolipoamide acetyltransferase)